MEEEIRKEPTIEEKIAKHNTQEVLHFIYKGVEVYAIVGNPDKRILFGFRCDKFHDKYFDSAAKCYKKIDEIIE